LSLLSATELCHHSNQIYYEFDYYKILKFTILLYIRLNKYSLVKDKRLENKFDQFQTFAIGD